MGRPKIRIIDDSVVEAEIKDQRSKIKDNKKVKRARSESVEAIGAVESAPEEGTPKESVSQQTNSEASKKTSEPEISKPSGASRPNERATEKKAQKPGKAKPRSKKYQELARDLDRSKYYSLTEAVDTVKKLSYSKFDATLEAHINTSQTGIRGLVSLPYATGRKLRILAFGKGAEQSGADIFGSEETIEEVNKGKINFDIMVTTPEWMPKLAKVARILGPRGLIPNPKNGTITEDLKKAVEGFQAGKTEYKTEPKAPVLHLAVGKINQPSEELVANIKALLQTLGKSRVKKVTLSPTMGPGVKIDLSSI